MRVLTYTLTAVLLTLMATFAQAEQKQRVGDWEVHYSAFNSTFLTPQIAAQYDITRSEKRGLINIAILDAETQKAVKALPKGHVSNPRGGVQSLEFKQIVEGDSVYYLASFLFGDEEVMKFNINIPNSKASGEPLVFEQKFYQE
ncbi:MAG: hypothetical protein COB75_00595 [Idiomarina sp.]|nr:DUF4426 domain-containing protein [Idiomarina sp.]PHQ77935.1 MAG: hypothetical protein COB75_00595 [Idiomarina sp.]